jgi:hypothetical protein
MLMAELFIYNLCNGKMIVIIGVDADGNGIGEPVTTFKKPNVGKSYQYNHLKKVMSLIPTKLVCNGNGVPIENPIILCRQVPTMVFCVCLQWLKSIVH